MKYKLWDITNNCWYDHGDIYLDEDGQLFCIEELGGYTPYMNKENVTARYELVRFTGMVDNDGNEVWEDDIRCSDLGRQFVVKYDVKHVSYIAAYNVLDYDFLSDCAPHSFRIGNVYENPEFLGGTNNA